ncbi:hypothetical protein F5Y16DRAFT_402047 [Xylariaceae sp. FL0255]|nr:hypothetical protein F5Y16DRAFT_402047 [Xylariaceae sp. FL0255]
MATSPVAATIATELEHHHSMETSHDARDLEQLMSNADGESTRTAENVAIPTAEDTESDSEPNTTWSEEDEINRHDSQSDVASTKNSSHTDNEDGNEILNCAESYLGDVASIKSCVTRVDQNNQDAREPVVAPDIPPWAQIFVLHDHYGQRFLLPPLGFYAKPLVLPEARRLPSLPYEQKTQEASDNVLTNKPNQAPSTGNFVRYNGDGQRFFLPPPGFNVEPLACPEIPTPEESTTVANGQGIQEVSKVVDSIAVNAYGQKFLQTASGFKAQASQGPKPLTFTKKIVSKINDQRSGITSAISEDPMLAAMKRRRTRFAPTEFDNYSQPRLENLGGKDNLPQNEVKEAKFWNALFQVEEDYIYNSRFPLSTF